MSVYFITARETGRVKIGCSLEPHARLRELQASCPHALKLEGMMDGEFAEEGDLHYRFAAHRLHGEWFILTPEIEDLIAANPPKAKPVLPQVSRAKRKRPPIIFGETAREYEQRLRDEEHGKRLAERRAAATHWLERKVEAGDIHFPFRAKEPA